MLFLTSIHAVTEAQKVKSGSFNLVLKTILSSKIPSVTVGDISGLKNIVFMDCREKKFPGGYDWRNALIPGRNDRRLYIIRHPARCAPC